MALAALARLPDEIRRRIVWLIVGPPGEADYVDQLRRLASESDCDIRMPGKLSDRDIRDLYGACDFFCLTGVPDPSGRIEGFGLVYLEAAAVGLPSVATAIGGVPDAVVANKTGALVEPSIDAIAHAINRLVTERELRVTLAEHARMHARTLSWERCAAETYGLPHSAERNARHMQASHQASAHGERLQIPAED